MIDVLYVVRNLREADRHEIFATRWDEDEETFVAQVVTSYGPMSHVALHDGRPVACFGFHQAWPGVYEAWMFATDELPRIALGLTKFARRVMIPYLIAEGAQRCEARSMVGHAEAHRWMRTCGAVQEARLRRYGRNGEDFLVFRLKLPNVHIEDPRT